MVKEGILYWIAGSIFIIFSIILIIQLILKLVGHSPTDIQILYMLIVAIISFLFTANYKMGRFVGKVDEFMDITKNSFKRIRDDIDKLRKDLE